MLKKSSISTYQFATFRIIFALYLIWHFAELIPYADELFSRDGLLADPALSPTYSFFPNILTLIDSSTLALKAFLGLLLVLSFFILSGFQRRISAAILWYGWACLLNRNPLISNPGIPYVGLILVFLSTIPSGEALSKKTRVDWHFPASIYAAGWILLAAGYTFSGLVKLESPSWLDGSAMLHLTDNPLARPGLFRNIFLSLPESITDLFTYFSLAGEILFLPLSLTRKTRLIAWSWMFLMHLGIISMVAFADLTLGMLMMHLFLFDPGWLPPAKNKAGKMLVLFDGVCGLCNRSVRFFIDQDPSLILRFAPLQSEKFKDLHSGNMQSVVLIDDYNTDQQKSYDQSTAVLKILEALGGFWRLVALLRIIPRPLRDFVYNIIAKNRYRWFGKVEECGLMNEEDRKRFIG